MDQDGRHGRTRQLDDESLAAMLASPLVANLTSLSLDSCPLGDASAQAFPRIACAPSLASLRVWCTPLSSVFMGALADATLPALEHLDLWMNFAHARELSALTRFPTLRALRIGRNRATAEVAGELAAALPVLADVSFCETPLGDAGVQALLDGACAPALRHLDLSCTEIDGDAIKAIVRSHRLDALRSLDLYGNKVGAPGVRALAAAPFDRMARLAVGDNMRGDPAPIFADAWLPYPNATDTYERRLDSSGQAIAAVKPKRPPSKRTTPPTPAPPARDFDPEGEYEIGERVRHAEHGAGRVIAVEPTYIAVKFRIKGELRWQRVPAAAIPYDVKRRFAAGEFVLHAAFGAGIVRIAAPERVDVEFWAGGVKTLVHAKR